MSLNKYNGCMANSVISIDSAALLDSAEKALKAARSYHASLPRLIKENNAANLKAARCGGFKSGSGSDFALQLKSDYVTVPRYIKQLERHISEMKADRHVVAMVEQVPCCA